ncbi:hypothetical protein BMETH_35361104734, partial [methanotrophic bacterial endosymbiont of Bathymodiolus sp.]
LGFVDSGCSDGAARWAIGIGTAIDCTFTKVIVKR